MFRSLLVCSVLIAVGCSPAKPSQPISFRLQSLEGIQETLAGNAGKVVVLDLWALW